MEIGQLEQFVAVAEEHGFTRAAQRLHVVQSAVSYSVKMLEREVGVELLERSPQGVTLTSEGAEFLVAAQGVLAAVDEARDVAASFGDEVRGTVAVGILAAPDIFQLPTVFARFRALHPRVTLSIRTSATGSAGLVGAIMDESLDFSLLVLPTAVPAGIEFEEVVHGDYQLGIAADHPLAARTIIKPADLRGEQFVMLAPGFATRTVLEGWVVEHDLRPSALIELADQSHVASYIAAGLGVGLLNPWQAGLPGIVVLPVEGWDLSWTVAIATKKSRRLSAAAAALIQLMREHIAAAALRSADAN